jgi:hypothetical protein
MVKTMWKKCLNLFDSNVNDNKVNLHLTVAFSVDIYKKKFEAAKKRIFSRKLSFVRQLAKTI